MMSRNVLSNKNQQVLICKVCNGTDFYEDVNGLTYCDECGVQNDEIVPISFEVDDNEDDNLLIGGYRIKSRVGTQHVTLEDPTLKDFMITYQYALKLLAIKVEEHSQVSNIVLEVKNLWFDYLNILSKDSTYLVNKYFNQSILKTKRPNTHPFSEDGAPMLTKPLLLGFIALACRNLRSWILPCNLVQWSVDGIVPYLTLWEALPNEIKQTGRLNRKHRSVFQLEMMNYSPTPINILFHMQSLGEFLNKPIVPLNTPLIAHSFIKQLQLPMEVWKVYSKFAQLWTPNSPIPEMEVTEVMHVEHIMACIVAACKLCKGWLDWSYVLDSDVQKRECPLPRDLVDAEHYPRSSLEMMLDRYQTVLKPKDRSIIPETRDESFARPIRQLSASRDLQLKIPSLLDKESNNGNNNNNIDNNNNHSCNSNGNIYIRPNRFLREGEVPECMESQGLLRKMMNDAVDTGVATSFKCSHCGMMLLLKKWNFHLRKHPECKDASLQSVKVKNPLYLTYAMSKDESGTPHLEYTVLVERCARHVMIHPRLLFDLVEGIDLRMVEKNKQVSLATEHEQYKRALKKFEKSAAGKFIKKMDKEREKKTNSDEEQSVHTSITVHRDIEEQEQPTRTTSAATATFVEPSQKVSRRTLRQLQKGPPKDPRTVEFRRESRHPLEGYYSRIMPRARSIGLADKSSLESIYGYPNAGMEPRVVTTNPNLDADNRADNAKVRFKLHERDIDEERGDDDDNDDDDDDNNNFVMNVSKVGQNNENNDDSTYSESSSDTENLGLFVDVDDDQDSVNNSIDSIEQASTSSGSSSEGENDQNNTGDCNDRSRVLGLGILDGHTLNSLETESDEDDNDDDTEVMY